MNVIEPGLSKLFHRGSLLCDHHFSSLLIHRTLSLDIVHVLALVFPILADRAFLLVVLRHVAVETRCKYHSMDAGARLIVMKTKKSVSIASNALA